MLIKDSDGQLARHLAVLAARRTDPAGEAQGILDRLLNWLAFGLNVLARGERIRAHELLGWVQAACCDWPGCTRAALRTGRTPRAAPSRNWTP